MALFSLSSQPVTSCLLASRKCCVDRLRPPPDRVGQRPPLRRVPAQPQSRAKPKGLAYKFARFWALSLVGKRCPGPRSSLLDALTGLLAELEAFLARRIGVVQLLARDEEPAQRPPEAPDGTCRVSVVLSDVGFRLCHGTSSRLHRKHPARVRSLLGDPGATPRDAVGRSWVQSRASTARGSRRPWRSHSSGPAPRV